MRLPLRILFLSLLMAIIAYSGCGDVAESDYYNFKVQSSNGSFSGYYSVDGGDFKYFSSEAVSGTIYNKYEHDLNSPDSLLVSVTADSDSSTAISIYIYENSGLVEDITVTQSTDSSGNALKITASLSYEFTSDDSTDSTSK